jgi:hypothetical protein
MRGGLDIGREVAAGVVALHVNAALPQLARAYIEHLTLMGHIDGITFFSVDF